MTKYIIGVIVVILLLGAGTYYGFFRNTAPPITQPTPVVTQQPVTDTYATSTFSISYPDGFTVNDQYAYQGVPNKPIAGVSFTIPMTMATGTNLDSDTYVSVEWLPRAKVCTGDIFLEENVKSSNEAFGSTTYSVATTSEGAAGSFTDEDVFAIPGSTPCTAVRYDIHYADINNFPAGAVQAFDEQSLLSTFDTIRDSLTLTPQQ